ncbi:MAG TPA: hypothetical protein VG406_02735 [Isosphaeraceae bacterium]|jgi:hypothetical protein|nr:hypothetical protein [Isosphaeraceae bacterium]
MTGNGLVRGVLVLVAASGVLAATARAADEKDVVGTWKLKYEPGDGQTHEPVLTITKDGADLKGEFAEGDQKGTVKEVRFKDGELRVKVESKYDGEPTSVTYTGKTDGDAWKGDAAWEYQGMSGTFPFEAKRQVAKPKDEKAAIGTWKLSFNPGNGPHEAKLTVTEEKSGLKGKFVDGDKELEVEEVKFKDGKLTVSTRTENDGEPATALFEGKVKGDAIEGEARWEYKGGSGSFFFDGKREVAKPKG